MSSDCILEFLSDNILVNKSVAPQWELTVPLSLPIFSCTPMRQSDHIGDVMSFDRQGSYWTKGS